MGDRSELTILQVRISGEVNKMDQSLSKFVPMTMEVVKLVRMKQEGSQVKLHIVHPQLKGLG